MPTARPPQHKPKFSMDVAANQRPIDQEYVEGLSAYFSSSMGTQADRLHSFTKYVPRADIIRFIVANEIFKMILDVPGAIIECGVHLGGGLMTWAQLSAIYEPINHTRRVVGFDTFSGFPTVGPNDATSTNELAHPGALAVDAVEDIKTAIGLYDLTRPINHIPRVTLVQGDATKTIPQFLIDNSHTVVSLLHLDFDIFEPTCVALKNFLPRMPKGAVILFDELDHPKWPGETLAVLETVGLRNLRIKRFPYQPQLSYAQLE